MKLSKVKCFVYAKDTALFSAAETFQVRDLLVYKITTGKLIPLMCLTLLTKGLVFVISSMLDYLISRIAGLRRSVAGTIDIIFQII